MYVYPDKMEIWSPSSIDMLNSQNLPFGLSVVGNRDRLSDIA